MRGCGDEGGRRIEDGGQATRYENFLFFLLTLDSFGVFCGEKEENSSGGTCGVEFPRFNKR